jgi:hypothetical protein
MLIVSQEVIILTLLKVSLYHLSVILHNTIEDR